MENLIGKRIELISMYSDPNPIASGDKGTVYHIGGGVINVKWDSGRTLGLISGVDRFTIIK